MAKSKIQNLPRKEKQLIELDTCNDHENYLLRKEKTTAVFNTRNDHENYTQHSYRFFFSLSYKPSLCPQRVVSLEATREVCCVMVSQYVQIQDRHHATVADITFRGPYTSRNSRDLVNHTVSTFKRFY